MPANLPTPALPFALIAATLLTACADEAPADDTTPDAVVISDAEGPETADVDLNDATHTGSDSNQPDAVGDTTDGTDGATIGDTRPDSSASADTASVPDTSQQTEDTSAIDTGPPRGDIVQPLIGVWTYDQQGIRNNTCGSYAATDDDAPFRVIASADGRFEIEQNDPGNFDCTITGGAFVCPSRIYNEFPIDNTDAVLIFNVRIDGTIESERRLSGTQTVDVTCTGVSCAAAPAVLGVSFPCAWEVPFVAEFVL